VVNISESVDELSLAAYGYMWSPRFSVSGAGVGEGSEALKPQPRKASEREFIQLGWFSGFS
jgi:hypothetical protein